MTSTDLLIGVVNAADPVRYRQAIAALERQSTAAGTHVAAPSAHTPAKTAGSAGANLPANRHETSTAGVQFEAFVLQTFIEPMLPSGEGLYGGGSSAGFWKSMLAEKLADELARNGGIGLARQIGARPG